MPYNYIILSMLFVLFLALVLFIVLIRYEKRDCFVQNWILHLQHHVKVLYVAICFTQLAVSVVEKHQLQIWRYTDSITYVHGNYDQTFTYAFEITIDYRFTVSFEDKTIFFHGSNSLRGQEKDY